MSSRSVTWPAPAWSTAVLAGVAIPVLAMLVLLATSSPLALASGPIFTLGLMGIGIIATATVGHFWIGVALALMNAACLLMLALALGMPALPHPVSTTLALVIASGSFAARGALFAKTLSHRGWLMALFVVAGEGSVLLLASVWPGALPQWFLALLPAQWASIAIQTALTGTGTYAAMSVLIALAGTAATTLLAARLWLHRWPYLLMFTTWLGLSALVYFWSAPTTPNADLTVVASAATRAAPIVIGQHSKKRTPPMSALGR
ncbi:hypothetical protein R0135_01300 [Congregibacter variabilis]|uniref:Uncharacterized protein n=1 Tax=Congregibacter variabilis TaxID=3081200 RepID=A0ABZ0I2T9_9GAMM|nr:hypothetical protein R0135_01300 [Congregibacter sp. IMCC43200]